MTSPRERMLADVIQNMIIGVQKSEQVNKEMANLKEKVKRLNEREIIKSATTIAKNVTAYSTIFEAKYRKKPSPSTITKMIKLELGKI
jgi:hypothetical protein